MTIAIIAFACGVWWLQTQAALPPIAGLAWFAVIALLLAACGMKWRRLRAALPVAAFLSGIAWAGLLATQRLADALPLANEMRDIDVVGVIAEMPQQTDRGLRFRFDVETATLPVPRHVQLSWYVRWSDDEELATQAMPIVHAGERWHFRVRLKRPHGNLNPNGFDYEAWLFERDVRATGYVRAAPEGTPRDAFVFSANSAVERLRETLRARYFATLGDQPYAGILVALSVGDQQAIAPVLWQQFSKTGLTHLMRIVYLLKRNSV